MIPYIFTILLLNTYSGALGLALPESASKVPLSKSLRELANHCENPFLSTQIKSKLDECNMVVPPYNEKQFQCLIFYDINNQLCNAVASSTLALKDTDFTNDYTSKINEDINVEDLCVIARDWNFTSIADYPMYKDTVAKAFTMMISCMKICGNDEVTNLGSNFFCKYYKWGSEKLDPTLASVTGKGNVPSLPSSNNVAVVKDKNNVLLPPAAVKNEENAIAVSIAANTVTKPNETNKEIIEQVELPDKEEDKPEISLSNPSGLHTVKEDTLTDTAANQGSVDLQVRGNNSGKTVSASAPANPNLDNEGVEKPSAADVDPQKEKNEKVEESAVILPINRKDQEVDKTKPEPDDYQDQDSGDEGREGLPEGEDDRDDPMLTEVDQKQVVTKTKTVEKTQSSMTFDGERKFLKNSMDDEYYPYNDDHFLSFFLTAVILVIVLYVLYHNKNKVSKVFLGLIVEGRQSGRRRNSRGHAYRRLDTLEQAMSTNSAAPPSKIIY